MQNLFIKFRQNDAAKLILIWLLSAILDITWFQLDNSIPSWDQSAHLSGALTYHHYLQNLDIFNSTWWAGFWRLSDSYRGPFVYIVTVPFLQIFGLGYDQAGLVNLLFTAIISIGVYYLGKHLFNPQVGLWSAIFSVLFPSLIIARTDYLIDYGLTATVIYSFTCLTFWKSTESRLKSWLFSVGFAVGLGLIMLTKITGFFFLFFPGLWFLGANIKQKNWGKLLQSVISLMITWGVCGSWYGHNWLTIITSALSANRVGIIEGDPGPNTLSGWLYYAQKMPDMISFPLLIIPIVSVIFYKWKNPQVKIVNFSLIWLSVFCFGAYFLCSLGTNKDLRFILPFLPGLAIIFSYFINLFATNWGKFLRWFMVGITTIIIMNSLFIHGPHLVYRGSPFPHDDIINTMAKNNPYLSANLGIIDNNSAEINAFTFDFYGKLADFQVYARELKPSLQEIEKYGRSLLWYMTRTGEPNPAEKQVAFSNYVAQNPELTLYKSWLLPDKNKVNLYKRKQEPIIVEKVNDSVDKVTLESVKIPQKIDFKKPVPVTYTFKGKLTDLQQGIILLTWSENNHIWVHDHAIALGQLYKGKNPDDTGLKVTENLAMSPSSILTSNQFNLKAIYLHRQTGKTYNLTVPEIETNLNSDIIPELDLVSQLQKLGSLLRQGKIDPVFNEVGNLNLFDPTQDYLIQGEKAFNYRLNQDQNNLDLGYSIVLSQLLPRKVQPLLQTLHKLIEVDGKNAYLWTYLGFVNIYNFDGKSAEKALNVAESLNVNIPELKTLKKVARIMQFKFF
jgi:4-amino-4-deoxy-L-arabinose transferase-like glycosyltransferase